MALTVAKVVGRKAIESVQLWLAAKVERQVLLVITNSLALRPENLYELTAAAYWVLVLVTVST